MVELTHLTTMVAVEVAVTGVPAECEPGEEDDGDDEDATGDDRHPGGDLGEPVRLR